MQKDAGSGAPRCFSEQKRRQSSRLLRYLVVGLVPAATAGCPAFADDPYVVRSGTLGANGGESGASTTVGGPGGAADASVGGAGGEAAASPGGAGGEAAASPGGAGGEAAASTGGAGGEAAATTGGVAGTAGAEPGGTGGTGGITGGAGGSLGVSMIDDLEDRDLNIIEHEGRQGDWFDTNDGRGVQVMQVSSGGPSGSLHALQTAGSGFSSWGAGVGFDLNREPGGPPGQAYDASAYTGLTFWLRISPGTTRNIRVAVADRQTEPRGGICFECYDNFGVDIVASTQWQQYTFSWDDLRQEGWGSPLRPAIDPSALYVIEFMVDQNAMFDFMIDNVAFTR